MCGVFVQADCLFGIIDDSAEHSYETINPDLNMQCNVLLDVSSYLVYTNASGVIAFSGAAMFDVLRWITI